MAKRVVILCGHDYEDMELQYPRYRLLEAGHEVLLAGEKANEKYLGKHGYPVTTDCVVSDLDHRQMDGIVLPGGWMPDKLRRDPATLNLIKNIHDAGKPVAAICHGGWLAISAGVYKGMRVTGSPGIKDDCINAGAIWEDAEVVIDRNHVSSRRPDDLPAFMKGVLGLLDADA